MQQRATAAPGNIANGEKPAAHVAIVCDGSARWATARGLSINQGHEAAADTVLARVGDAVQLGLSQLTLYAFSTENWTRPADEVMALFAMLARRIARDTRALHAQDVRVRFIGRRDRAAGSLSRAIEDAERMTAANRGLALYVAVDYGGRDEIVSAAERYRGGGERAFAELLGAPGMRDPDLLIRTSGEQRLSNFLLWQAAYAELLFCRELWPDFTREAFERCLAEYSRRGRRFGGRAELTGLTPAVAPATAIARVAHGG
ncbi:MAG TPA: polyprenyl diphosphate synthase [Solirubrobacteraceae bacterium]|jgi:undecaprenyl diphosphate synthase|nr:polyprenyl diphosphate synthase [Solirubrobacteraceae bacterium]